MYICCYIIKSALAGPTITVNSLVYGGLIKQLCVAYCIFTIILCAYYSNIIVL